MKGEVVLEEGAYREQPVEDGWVASPVRGDSFRLTRHTDAMGLPSYRLERR